MCLYTKQKKAKIAIFPKIRYKVLCFDDVEKVYYTPFQKIKLLPISKQILKAKYFYIKAPSLGKPIEYGIHTFTNIDSAKYMANVRNNARIFKVIIPTFTKYFDGEFAYPYDSSCSEKIRFIKEINSDEYTN